MSTTGRPSIRKIVDLDEEQRRYLKVIERAVGGRRKEPDSISKILDHLYLGSQQDAMDTRKLKQLGITHILNTVDGTFQSTTSRAFYPDEVKYLGFKSDDLLNYPIMKHFDDTYSFIEDARTSGGKCLIHCISGVNRSGALAVGYIMVHSNIGPITATQLVRDARGTILTNHGFIERLVKFADDKNLLTLDAEELEKPSTKR